MPKLKRSLCLTLFIALSCLFSATQLHTAFAGTNIETFTATLDGAQENPAVATTASGKAILVLDENGTTLRYHIEVADIDGIAAGHIHDGVAGVNGGVVVALDVSALAPGVPAIGTVELSSAQVSALQASGYYINIHTADVGSGEIRGQITPHAFDVVGAVLASSVATDASGVVRFQQTAVDSYDYEIAVNDIVSITVAHIHAGVNGATGGVVTALNVSGLTPTSSSSGSVAFASGESLFSFLTAAYYVNVHTAAFGGGEMRGQTTVAPMLIYRGEASGAQEVPAAMTDAEGVITLVVGSDWQSVFYRTTVSDLENIAASHIHEAPAQSNGGVLFDLGADYADDDAEGALTFDILNLADLVAERMYLNVHTAAFAGGEIRGQLLGYTPVAGSFPLAGGQEVPSVASDASGNASIGINLDNTMSFNVLVSDIVSPTAAHVHEGAAGTNGSIVFALPFPTSRAARASLALIGTQALSAEQMAELLSGEYYVNIHTEANGGGELRGQLFAEVAPPTAVQLSGQSSAVSGNVFIISLTLMIVAVSLAAVSRMPKSTRQ